jgi:hypothetical protein
VLRPVEPRSERVTRRAITFTPDKGAQVFADRREPASVAWATKASTAAG